MTKKRALKKAGKRVVGEKMHGAQKKANVERKGKR